MTRRCSHCSHNGHNSRTCPNRGVKLFGVRLTDGSSIRKSASMGNLSHYTGSSTGNLLHHGGSSSSNNNNNHPLSPGGGETPDNGAGPGAGAGADGYASEDFVKGSSSSCRDRKKGVPWTEDEHRMFLLGLQKLGKGDWRGIARNYVISRTPTQVASHAQKYFIRQTNMSRRKRRSSLFDIVADESADTQFVSHELFPMSHHHQSETQSNNNQHLPAPPSIDEECESMDSTNSNDEEAVISNPESLQLNYPVMIPTYFSPFVPYPLPYWPGGPETIPKETHKVVKPTAVHSNSPINVDELVGMSKLSLGERSKSSPSLSLSLQQGSNRQSAFHANPTTETSSMNSNSSSLIHAL